MNVYSVVKVPFEVFVPSLNLVKKEAKVSGSISKKLKNQQAKMPPPISEGISLNDGTIVDIPAI